jgi:hypothetical protein
VTCSEVFQTRNSRQRTTPPTWWSGYTTPTTKPDGNWRWPATAWRPATIAWPIRPDSRKVTMPDCTARLRPGGSRRSCNRHGKVCTRSSPGLTTLLTEFSGTTGQEWWWYTLTDWRHTWGLRGTSSLKEGAMLRSTTMVAS